MRNEIFCTATTSMHAGDELVNWHTVWVTIAAVIIVLLLWRFLSKRLPGRHLSVLEGLHEIFHANKELASLVCDIIDDHNAAAGRHRSTGDISKKQFVQYLVDREGLMLRGGEALTSELLKVRKGLFFEVALCNEALQGVAFAANIFTDVFYEDVENAQKALEKAFTEAMILNGASRAEATHYRVGVHKTYKDRSKKCITQFSIYQVQQ